MFPYVPEGCETSQDKITREELLDLGVKVDEELKTRLAKFNTLCPIRAEIHRMLFDELIRQIVIEDAQQG